MLEEAIGAFQYADDSDGNIGYLAAETLDAIRGIARKSKEKEQQAGKIFKRLLNQMDHDIFDRWDDYQIDLMSICLEFADDPGSRERLKIKIESMMENASSERSANYRNESLLSIQMPFLKRAAASTG